MFWGLVPMHGCPSLRALRLGYLTQEMIDGYEPLLMFTIPRLAIIRWVQPPGAGDDRGGWVLPAWHQALLPQGNWGPGQPPDVSWALTPCSGLLIYPEGPLSLERSPEQMPRVFSPFYNLLKKIRFAGEGNGHPQVGPWGSSGAMRWG